MPAPAFPDESTANARTYAETVRPLLARYCRECHSGDVTEADIDLAAFATVADVRRQPKVWKKVREMLDGGQMPPKDAPQPSDAERMRLATWVRDFLAAEARASAGDPGPVMLRRLSNAEYTYTIRDLTGVASLYPTKEFPVDGAAGEGFTNVGSGQGMSPALVQKYFDAAKGVAEHAVLTPAGIRFSPYITRRDQTNELLAQIQAFYRRYTTDGGGSAVNLQGIRFDTNQGGRLPLERYLSATLAERDALKRGQKSLEQAARERSLSPRYLGTLWNSLSRDPGESPSSLNDRLRERWRRSTAGDAAALSAEIESLQKMLWKFNAVGQIGRPDGPKSWMEAVSPFTTSQQLRLKLPDASPGADVVFYLAASDFDFGDRNGKGGESDEGGREVVVLQRPRIELPADRSGPRAPILLRDIRLQAQRAEGTIASESSRTAKYLAAVVQLQASSNSTEEVARQAGLDANVLAKWTARVRFGERAARRIAGHFTEKLTNEQYDAIRGWGTRQTPCLLTNRSERPITLGTLTVPARGVTVHPSPNLEAIVAWRSPIDGEVRIAGRVADADDKCGNGAAWRLELLAESGSRVLAGSVIDNGREKRVRLAETVRVKAGDVVSLAVNARDGSHVCDTTQVEWKLQEVGGKQRVWDLASDVVDQVHEGNPLPDSYGNRETWHFCAAANRGEKPQTEPLEAMIPPSSALARWRDAAVAGKTAELETLAMAVQKVLTADDVAQFAEPDKAVRRRLLTGFETDLFGKLPKLGEKPAPGKTPRGPPLDAADLCLQTTQVLEVRLPAELVAGGEFVATAVLSAESATHGGVRLQATPQKPVTIAASLSGPILVSPGDGQRRMEAAVNEFRDLFPPALCYARIVPVDEVVTLTLFYREDEQLQRLMLDESQIAELDRIWDELFFVSREPLKLAVSLEQIAEFATQDNPDGVKAFAAMRKPINDRAEAFRRRLIETEPTHLDAALDFAGRVWRRPLTDDERQTLRGLYRDLRESEIEHELAIRLVLARVLTSPAFLYKLERPAPGNRPAPVSDLELAARLSYFLWSSLPDEPLRSVAADGKLTDDAQLVAQAKRMLRDPRTQRLAIQFACQWLHVRDFDQSDDKNEKLYPDFASLRGDMYEETVRFLADLFENDGSILDMLRADHTFVNASLARHYGIPGVDGSEWRRVDGVRRQGRGGVLGMATVLASQSGASRTSPILRGNWIYETLLGERLPRPPAGVPQLPDTVPEGLTARQLIERHSSQAACAKCHARIDPYGFALEQYDAIGRLRPNRVDTKTTLPGGKSIEGIDGLRDYLSVDRRDDFIRQFCRKLLGYALGREVQLSDEPLLTEMQAKLKVNDYRFHIAVEAIVTSRQFRDIRGAEQNRE